MKEQKTVLITGASSGIGMAAAVLLARKGYKVYAGVRASSKKEEIEKIVKEENLPIKLIVLDVSRPETFDEIISGIVREDQRLDILINNAGYSLLGFLEYCSREQIHSQFETNFFGPALLIKAALPIMRSQKSGRIINISSIYAELPFPMTSIYSATKYGLESLTGALRYELAPFNIQISTIQAGGVKTNFKKASVFSEDLHDENSPYYKSAGQYIKKMRSSVNSGISAQAVAEKIYRAIESKKMRRRYFVGSDARILFMIKQFLPGRIREIVLSKLFCFPKKANE